jgi:hypothetical protein
MKSLISCRENLWFLSTSQIRPAWTSPTPEGSAARAKEKKSEDVVNTIKTNAIAIIPLLIYVLFIGLLSCGLVQGLKIKNI